MGYFLDIYANVGENYTTNGSLINYFNRSYPVKWDKVAYVLSEFGSLENAENRMVEGAAVQSVVWYYVFEGDGSYDASTNPYPYLNRW